MDALRADQRRAPVFAEITSTVITLHGYDSPSSIEVVVLRNVEVNLRGISEVTRPKTVRDERRGAFPCIPTKIVAFRGSSEPLRLQVVRLDGS